MLQSSHSAEECLTVADTVWTLLTTETDIILPTCDALASEVRRRAWCASRESVHAPHLARSRPFLSAYSAFELDFHRLSGTD